MVFPDLFLTALRSPDGAKRNPGPASLAFPDYASLHPGYDVANYTNPPASVTRRKW
jgi:hypothetical protein